MAFLTKMRNRWHNASLKTSFMAYMLAFLFLALLLSLVSAAFFANLQNEVSASKYERSGMYLFDAAENRLYPADTIRLDIEGSVIYVQSATENIPYLEVSGLSSTIRITEDAPFLYLYQEKPAAVNDEPLHLTPDNLAQHDAARREELARLIEQNSAHPYAAYAQDLALNGVSQASPGLRLSPVGYYVFDALSPTEESREMLWGLLAFLMFPLWFGVCIFAAARRFYRTRINPALATLDQATNKIAEQDLDFTTTYERADEMGTLVASFETMRASLAASQKALWRTAEERKRLNAAFAHDLRTPLTVLHGKIELLQERLKADVPAVATLKDDTLSLARQVERIEHYVQAMSGLQSLEDREVLRSSTDIHHLRENLLETSGALCKQAHIICEVHLDASTSSGSTTVEVDEAIVIEVAENLLANACRYATHRITLTLIPCAHKLVLVVEDDGPGFSQQALKKASEPFFSEAPSRDHFGLGLNVSTALCKRHAGALAINNSEKGALVTASFCW